jgi:hypothetical protein
MGIGGVRMQDRFKFRLSETNWVEFSQKELDNFQNVNFIDENSKGKIIPVKRTFDNQTYQVIAPLDMIELLED